MRLSQTLVLITLTINFARLTRLHAESLSKNVKNRDQCYKANLAVKQLP